jgi:DNA helicase IV
VVRDMLVGYARTRPKPARDEDHPGRPTARASRWDLEHMFGNRRWMERLIEKTEGAVLPKVAAEMTEHTRIQFLDSAEKAYGHVDREQLATLDGRGIDEGTPTEDANSVDLEDLAVLFELERIRARAAGAEPAVFAAYHCVVVDEAQEFAPLELALMGRAVRRDGTVIVAGDAAQQLDPTTSFGGWDRVLEEMGARGADRAVLEVSYRCPPDVTALARNVLSPASPLAVEEPSIARVRHETLFHLAVWLTAELRELVGEDPQATAAVICRSPEAARTFARFLAHGTPPHLALGGEFEFRPGLTVSCVQEVKGLEFDYVAVPDATPGSYPDTPESRRALYVALTRATHRLVLAAAGGFSPLLRSG